MTQTPNPPAGWHPDPHDPSKVRYWDGTAWTDHTEVARPGTPLARVTPAHQQPGSPRLDKGKRLWFKKKRWIATGVVLALLIIGGIAGEAGSSKKDDPTPAASDGTSKAVDEPASVEPTPTPTPLTPAQKRAAARAARAAAAKAAEESRAAAAKAAEEARAAAAKAAAKKRAAAQAKAAEQAIGAAEDYLSFSAFSREGLIDQLSSSAGSGFPRSQAEYAVDHIDVDWNEQAVKAAKEYLSFSHFSRAGLIEQLESSAGSKFTHAQAVHGADGAGL
jgi:hypothetical protein